MIVTSCLFNGDGLVEKLGIAVPFLSPLDIPKLGELAALAGSLQTVFVGNAVALSLSY